MTLYTALIYRPNGAHYDRCSGDADRSDSLFEKLSTEDRGEVVAFFSDSLAEAALNESGDYSEFEKREHFLFANGIPYDENYLHSDEADDVLHRDLEAIFEEAKAATEIRVQKLRDEAAEKARLEAEKAKAAKREMDLRTLASLDRQRAELAKKLETTP